MTTMDFKTALVILLHFLCQISAQTGSSFFYYYSPNQPMQINSQTFGNNAQAHQQLLPSSTTSNNNPFNFNPSSFHSHHQHHHSDGFPTASPFLPHRQPYESLLDKITFSNPPTTHPTPQIYQPSQVPSVQAQTPTSTFPGQPQPSAKLFNFLNQPFQFFQNSFDRFQNPQQQQTQHTQQQPQQPQQQQRQHPQQYIRPISQSQQPIVLPTTAPDNNLRFYNYYNNRAVQAQPQIPLGSTANQQAETPSMSYRNPVTYVNQFFSAKTTQGPTSYTLTIEANPTSGPTATVHVSMGTPKQFHLPVPPLRTNNNQDTEIPETVQRVQPEVIETVRPIRPSQDEIGFETLTTTPQPISTSTTEISSTTPTTTTTIRPEPPTTETIDLTSSTTTTTTTTTLKPASELNVEEHKQPQKRVILRKKLARRRNLRIFDKNANSISEDDSNKSKEPIVVPVVVSTESPTLIVSTTPTTLSSTSLPTSTLRPVRIRTSGTRKSEVKRTRTTTSAYTTETTTTSTFEVTPSEPSTTEVLVPLVEAVPITPETTRKMLTSTTTEYPEVVLSTEREISSPHITTEAPYRKAVTDGITLAPVTETQTTETTFSSTFPAVESLHEPILNSQPVVNSSKVVNYPEYDEDYYEYYSDSETPSQNNEVPNASLHKNNSKDSLPDVFPSNLPNTDSSSSPAPETSSISNNKVQDEIHSSTIENSSPSSVTESNRDNYFVEASSDPPLEEDIIEPLSTTEIQEPSSSTTESILEITTEKVNRVVIDDVVGTTTTMRNDPEPMVSSIQAKEIELPNNKVPEEQEEKTEVPRIDYLDDPVVGVEVGGAVDKDSNLETNSQNKTQVKPENGVPQATSGDDFPEYAYSQEDYPKVDEALEDKIIQEDQRFALQTALKNIRNRLQNASSTTEKPEDDTSDHPKKFMRRPIPKDAFPSSTSTSISISSSYENEEIGDSRTQIIRKIQTFKTKLRKVASGVRNSTLDNNFVRSTTKRPRRVTRPSDKTTSSTPDATISESNEDTPNETIKEGLTARKVSFKNAEVQTLKPPTKIRSTTTTKPTIAPEVIILDNEHKEIEINNVEENEKSEKNIPNERLSDPNQITEKSTSQPEAVQPKNSTKLIGELIIHEILPTQSTTTEAIDEDEDIQNSFSDEEKTTDMDFETENSSTEDEIEIHSSTRTPVESRTSISSSSEYDSETVSSTSTSVRVETSDSAALSKSETVRERKVKVILKRRKGAPKGTGTIARQVVRTRTRVRPKTLETSA